MRDERKEELEAMQLDGALGNALLDQKGLNLEPLVALKLDDLASLLILNEGTVACEFLSDRAKSVLGIGNPRSSLGWTYLLESLQELPGVVFWRTGDDRDQISDESRDGSKSAHLWGDPARLSVSCGHFVVGCGYGHSSAGFLRPHY
jgi:hypothetical protein